MFRRFVLSACRLKTFDERLVLRLHLWRAHALVEPHDALEHARRLVGFLLALSDECGVVPSLVELGRLGLPRSQATGELGPIVEGDVQLVGLVGSERVRLVQLAKLELRLEKPRVLLDDFQNQLLGFVELFVLAVRPSELESGLQEQRGRVWLLFELLVGGVRGVNLLERAEAASFA